MTIPAPGSDTTAGSGESHPDIDGLFALLVATSQMIAIRYPNRHGAFERVVKLAEETGEVAEQINIWAGTGIKRQKHGEFDPRNLAAELSDVMRAAVGIALEFGIVDLVGDQIRARHTRALEDTSGL
jgi:NTP pyrophosphatase (non-canonical NTP hydrolase)